MSLEEKTRLIRANKHGADWTDEYIGNLEPEWADTICRVLNAHYANTEFEFKLVSYYYQPSVSESSRFFETTEVLNLVPDLPKP